jgi:hypothetical protein
MSIRRLRRLTAEIDEQHRQSMASIDAELGDLHVGTDPDVTTSRRRFLTKAAAGGAIAFGATAVPVATLVPAALAQTGGTTPGSKPPGSAAPPKSTAKVEGADLAIVIFLQTIELAAVEIYNSIGDSGRLSSPVAESARQFALHHHDHAIKFAEYAGNQATNTPNSALIAEIAPRIASAELDRDQAEKQLAQVAFDLESGMAATHSFALGQFDGWEIASIGATIEPVESQHALAWSLVIEPDAAQWKNAITTWIPPFQNEDGAFLPSQYAAS